MTKKHQPKCISIDDKLKFLVPIKEGHNEQEAITFRYVDRFGKRTRSKKTKTGITQYCSHCEAPNGKRKNCRICKNPLEEILDPKTTRTQDK